MIRASFPLCSTRLGFFLVYSSSSSISCTCRPPGGATIQAKFLRKSCPLCTLLPIVRASSESNVVFLWDRQSKNSPHAMSDSVSAPTLLPSRRTFSRTVFHPRHLECDRRTSPKMPHQQLPLEQFQLDAFSLKSCPFLRRLCYLFARCKGTSSRVRKSLTNFICESTPLIWSLHICSFASRKRA